MKTRKLLKKIPRVLILYTGGTFGMEIHADSRLGSTALSLPDLSPDRLRARFLSLVPELKDLAHCDVEILFNRDSSHIGPTEWIWIAAKIQKMWSQYDGIVLLHGTDTLAYTASALSFLLRPCLKPVVITGAQRPLSALRTDARTNLVSAVEIAAHGPREVVNRVSVFFGEQLFQGNRVRKKSASDFAAFESPHFPELAVLGTSIRYANIPVVNSKKSTLLQPKFSKNVLLSHVTPGFPSKLLSSRLIGHLDGLVLIVFHSWTAPTNDPEFVKLLRDAKKSKTPITIATDGRTQPPVSEIPRVTYEAGQELVSEGCYYAGQMTPECTFVKTSLLLAQPQGRNHFTKNWYKNYCNEGADL